MIWGRLIGTVFGWGFLGPIGAILGYLVGGWFDKGLKQHLHQIPRERTAAVQEAFFTATFSVMGYLAKADGRVSPNEIKVAKQVMDRLELNEEQRQEAIHLFSEGKNPAFDLETVISSLYNECKRHSDVLRFFIELQLEAVMADGELHPEKRRIFLLICQKLHFSSREFEQMWTRQWASQAFHEWFSAQFNPQAQTHSRQQSYSHAYQSSNAHHAHAHKTASLQDAYGVLGVPAAALEGDIKKAYRRLMNQHHPDKLAARGLPESMLKMAKEKTQQIRAAYDLVREERGFR